MDEMSDLLAVRHEKLANLQAAGVDPFGSAFPVDGDIAEIRAQFAEGKSLRLAGRITAHRNMGKSQFLDVSDWSGRIQIFVHPKEIGEAAWSQFQNLDLGDLIGIEGECFITKTGEPTIRVKTLTVLAKALRPLPSQWHGLADVELRYRQRYLDLLVNAESRKIFLQRITIIREIRSFLEQRGFLEVETPMMQTIPGGAAAEPFKTRHNALGIDLYLRIAPELFLKRLLVGGFTRIFEINRNFRNEGISRRHNPEFTMLEAYWAYADFEKMAALVEELICTLAEKICGTFQIEHRDAEGNVTRTINLARPWRRVRYHDAIEQAVPGWFALGDAERRLRCDEMGVQISPEMEPFEVTQQVFEKLVEEKTYDPLFVTHLPRELVPLARENPADKDLVDVYELIINGVEISPGYSELNDPIAQRRRLEHQAGDEQQKLDEEFLLALEHGMPPAGGIGIGIDRLIMLLTGAESIRDVILFPQLKPR
jgi:lysyl-tRNA synthetase class 2